MSTGLHTDDLLVRDAAHARELLLADAGAGTGMPCSRYGRHIGDATDVIYAAAFIFNAETSGDPVSWRDLNSTAGLVVNDSPDPEYVIRSYGELYGFNADELLHFDPSDDLPTDQEN